ncbi:hypothetical protein TURU_042263 [Turdus rufiventris]|nr:hypothetical protein TURU_042263 [Turdus rufiventris]
MSKSLKKIVEESREKNQPEVDMCDRGISSMLDVPGLCSLVNVLLQFRALSSTLCSSCGRDKADKTCLSNTSVSFQLRMKYFYMEAD